MNLIEMLHTQAAVRPDHVALVEGPAACARTVTFGGLAGRAAVGADWLRGRGLRRGDAVLLYAPMSILLYEVLLALWHGGMTAVMVDPAMGRAGLERCCRLLPIAGFAAVPKAHWLRLLSPAVRRLPIAVGLGGWAPGAPSWPGRAMVATAPAEILPPDHPALITFTSGSTGEPKGAVRTHGLLAAQFAALAPHLEWTPGQVELATLPVFALASLAAGVTTVLADVDGRRPDSVDAARILAQMRTHGVTRCTAAPAFLERLLDAEEAVGRSNHKLTHVATGGGPVFPRLLERLQRWAPCAAVSGVYGATEAEPMAFLPARTLVAADRAQLRSGGGVPAGHPVPALRLAILPQRWGTVLPAMSAAEFARLALPAGQPGEIVVSGAHVLPQYLGGAGNAAAKFSVAGVSWHRTGDAGYLDRAGRLWLLGRCAARIVDQRGELYPFAVEGVAADTPGVKRAALAAVRGRRILVLEPAVTAPAIDRAALGATLAWAQLDEIRIMDTLPTDRRHNSKIDYVRLARQLT